MVERRKPIVTELALDQLVNLIEESGPTLTFAFRSPPMRPSWLS